MRVALDADDSLPLQTETVVDSSSRYQDDMSHSPIPEHGAFQLRLPNELDGSPEASAVAQKTAIGSDHPYSPTRLSTFSPNTSSTSSFTEANDADHHQSTPYFKERTGSNSGVHPMIHTINRQSKSPILDGFRTNTNSPREDKEVNGSVANQAAGDLPKRLDLDHLDQGVEAARRRYRQEKDLSTLRAPETRSAHQFVDGRTSGNLRPAFPSPRISNSSIASGNSTPESSRQSANMAALMSSKGRSNNNYNAFASSSGGGRGSRFSSNPRQFNNLTRPATHAGNYHRNDQMPWRTWQEVTVRVDDLPRETTTRDLYLCFSKEGTLISIDILENPRGERRGRAFIRFWYGDNGSSMYVTSAH